MATSSNILAGKKGVAKDVSPPDRRAVLLQEQYQIGRILHSRRDQGPADSEEAGPKAGRNSSSGRSLSHPVEELPLEKGKQKSTRPDKGECIEFEVAEEEGFEPSLPLKR